MARPFIYTSKPYTVTVATINVLIGGILLFFKQELAFVIYHDSDRAFVFSLLSVVFFLPGVGFFLYLYLRGDINFPFLSRIVELSPPQYSIGISTESEIK